jgi:uncharacterized protein
MTPDIPLLTRLRNDLRAAMKQRDALSTTVLRSLLDALDNACAVPLTSEHALVYGDRTEVPRKLVTEAEYQAILRHEADSRSAAASEYEQLGRADVAARLHAELELVMRYVEA